MERRVSLTVFFVLFPIFSMFCQPKEISGKIHIPLWISVEAHPGTEEAGSSAKDPLARPMDSMRNLACLLIEGMIWGWAFEYVPADESRDVRNVAEYFEMTPVKKLGEKASGIRYSAPRIEDGILHCWIDFYPDSRMEMARLQWEAVQFPKRKGRGRGRLEDGFGGLYEASRAALQNAVHEYVRSISKNKPKEIRGLALITGTPRFYVDAGKYVAELDFFLDVSTILLYNGSYQ